MPKFADLFVAPENDPRADVPARADEKTMLAGFLRWQRQTLALKCSGLDPKPSRSDRWPSPACPSLDWYGIWPRSSASGFANG